MPLWLSPHILRVENRATPLPDKAWYASAHRRGVHLPPHIPAAAAAVSKARGKKRRATTHKYTCISLTTHGIVYHCLSFRYHSISESSFCFFFGTHTHAFLPSSNSRKAKETSAWRATGVGRAHTQLTPAKLLIRRQKA
jgi:hypothetical protein